MRRKRDEKEMEGWNKEIGSDREKKSGGVLWGKGVLGYGKNEVI